MMIELTYTEAKELINAIGRFTITNNQYYGLTVLEAENGAEYAIGTDDECDEAWDDCLDNYIEECVLYEIPEAYKFYFEFNIGGRYATFNLHMIYTKHCCFAC